jgi:hypothetical protein
MLKDSYVVNVILIERKETVRNREITFSLPEDINYTGKLSVKIGEQHLHTMRFADGSYATHFLPFRNYSSIKDLVLDIMDKVPVFRTESKV